MKTRWICLLPLLAGAVCASAAEREREGAHEHASEPPRFAPRSAQLERGAEQGARFAVHARFAVAESAGELREGGGLVLIGRLAKAAASCGSGTVFRDGFEGS